MMIKRKIRLRTTNKKQLIVAWVVGILISLLVIVLPKIAYFPTSHGIYAKVRAETGFIPQPDWNLIIQYSIPVLIIGGLLIYTLRDKR